LNHCPVPLALLKLPYATALGEAALREGALCSLTAPPCPALLACSARHLGPNPNLSGSFLFPAEEGFDGSKMSDSFGGKFVYSFFTSSLLSYHPLLPFPLMIPDPNLGAGFLFLVVLVIVLIAISQLVTLFGHPADWTT
jgi:hypothetical protein